MISVMSMPSTIVAPPWPHPPQPHSLVPVSPARALAPLTMAMGMAPSTTSLMVPCSSSGYLSATSCTVMGFSRKNEGNLLAELAGSSSKIVLGCRIVRTDVLHRAAMRSYGLTVVIPFRIFATLFPSVTLFRESGTTRTLKT